MRPGEIWRRFFRPARTIRPTREGWWFLVATVALGLAAFNTGNNLLYLLVSTLLGLIVVSGILSEQSMRGLRVTVMTPKEIFAGQSVLLGTVLTNTKRWRSSYSVVVESGLAGAKRVAYVARLEPGQEALVTLEASFARRGRQRLPGVRVVTRFPFGFFHKASRPVAGQEVLVYPAVTPLTPGELSGLAALGTGSAPRAGPGSEFHNLREYRWGDDPRLIHWKSSARADTLVVRELEAETALAVRLVLEPAQGVPAPESVEAAVSRAASLAAHLLGEGALVELAGPGVHVPLGGGVQHLRRILEALALFDVDREPSGWAEAAGAVAASLSVIRIPLGGPAAG